MKFLETSQSNGKKTISVLSILIIFNFTVISLSAQSERELMDEALKKELGDFSPKRNSETNSEGKKADAPTANSSTEVKSTQNGTSQSNSSETQQESNPVEERYRPKDEGPGIAGTLLRVVFILGLLCAALYYILKYVSKNREGRLPVRGEMSVLSSLILGPNKQLQIVEISQRLYVLGVADNGINLITEILDPEVKHRILQKKENFQPPEGGFLVTVLEQIKDLNSRISGNTEGPPDRGANREEKRKQARKKLEELKEKTSSLEGGLFDLK
ncbi:flagellar biosynthetic protein FliO [Leptospira kirschneri serovar Bim str. 1051]|uniref:flagellar biosynthetic protein FliO n=1 Tax=Leptospira kirschneri TaxID=29507 RepID=UPI0002892C01|nr:flagellar biosynthetic protein FliO [Leptospira kirschneri]EMK16971.1 flagellar biosynthetic protein FliO [Leptospira kirschneri serovar Bim str. PUO 1247]EMN04067.1 flagellar biosynthetic protein FliO [Leptospira kirschneri serovar Bim str. 1051]